MPVYEYECPGCGTHEETINSIEKRHTDAPECHACECEYPCQMKLVISPVAGFVDFPAAGGREYKSPTTGKFITSAKQRCDDLKRSGCRPYEGFEQESKHAKKVRAAEEKKSDAKLQESVARAYHQLSPSKRKALNAG